jgi:hypothetical protein
MPTEPITLRDKLSYVWKQLLAAPPKLVSPLIFDPRSSNHADNNGHRSRAGWAMGGAQVSLRVGGGLKA